MKSKFLASIIALSIATTSTFAYTTPSGMERIKEIPVSENYSKIIVDKNINVIIIPGETKMTVTVSADNISSDLIEVKVKRGIMKITSRKAISGEVNVYVPANNISYVELAEGASLSSQGRLTHNKLKVLVNVGSRVNVTSTAAVELISTSDCEVVYEKNAGPK